MTDVLKAPVSAPASFDSPFLRFYRSPIGKKLITGLTGLGLSVFVLVHMLGNLLLFVGRDTYNAYAHHIERWGWGLYLIEAVLLIAVLFHVALGIEIFASRLKARRRGYSQYHSAGSPSLQTTSSRSMIITGVILASFLVAHLLTFKFGPYYPTQLAGETVRDLAQLVIETFHKPLSALAYTAVMLLLGMHLRHGLWSALQSLGTLDRAIRPLAFSLGTVLAAAIALGFMVLPWGIYFDWVG